MTLNSNPWHHVTGTVPKRVWLEVCGDGGMNHGLPFLAIAKYEDRWPLEPWRDIQGDALSDCGWVPKYWRYLSTYPEEYKT